MSVVHKRIVGGVLLALLGGAIALLLHSWGPGENVNVTLTQNREFLEETPAPSTTARSIELDDIVTRMYDREAGIAERHLELLRSDVKPATVPTTDPEWESLPRTVFDFAYRFVRDLPGLEVTEIYRNNTVNPTDTYIPKHVRASLRAVFQAQKDSLLQLESHSRRIATEELDWLVAHGLARRVTYEEYLASLNEQEREEHVRLARGAENRLRKRMTDAGLDSSSIETAVAGLHVIKEKDLFGYAPFIHQRRDDEHFGAQLAELPQTIQATDIYTCAALELANLIVSTFENVDALNRRMADDIVDRVSRILDKRYPRSK